MNMSETPKVTYCIPSKNNKRYLEWSIPSIRKNCHRKDHDIFVFVDQDNDGTVEWLEKNKERYNIRYWVNDEDGLYGIGRAYDFLIGQATTEVVCAFHADMYMGKDADKNATCYLTRKSLVCSTRIEPPLHPSGKEKIVADFGMWPEPLPFTDGFREHDLNSFIDDLINTPTEPTDGAFAPWYIYKETIESIGGHDHLFRSAREDSDLFNRLSLIEGFSIIQSWKSFVYHLTCRGGQFEHGVLTTDHSQKSKDWQELMNQSTRDFIRKWGTNVKTTDTLHPVVHPVVPRYISIELPSQLVVTNDVNTFNQFMDVVSPYCMQMYFSVRGECSDIVEILNKRKDDPSNRIFNVEMLSNNNAPEMNIISVLGHSEWRFTEYLSSASCTGIWVHVPVRDAVGISIPPREMWMHVANQLIQVFENEPLLYLASDDLVGTRVTFGEADSQSPYVDPITFEVFNNRNRATDYIVVKNS